MAEFTETVPSSKYWVPPKYVTGPKKFWLKLMGYDASGNRNNWGKVLSVIGPANGLLGNYAAQRISHNQNAYGTQENVKNSVGLNESMFKMQAGAGKILGGVMMGNQELVQDGIGSIGNGIGQLSAGETNSDIENKGKQQVYKDGGKTKKNKRNMRLLDDYPKNEKVANYVSGNKVKPSTMVKPKIYSKDDKTEDIAMIDKSTGEKIGEMRYEERIFDQKANIKLEQLKKQADKTKKYATLGKFVAKELDTHDDFKENDDTEEFYSGGLTEKDGIFYKDDGTPYKYEVPAYTDIAGTLLKTLMPSGMMGGGGGAQDAGMGISGGGASKKRAKGSGMGADGKMMGKMMSGMKEGGKVKPSTMVKPKIEADNTAVKKVILNDRFLSKEEVERNNNPDLMVSVPKLDGFKGDSVRVYPNHPTQFGNPYVITSGDMPYLKGVSNTNSKKQLLDAVEKKKGNARVGSSYYKANFKYATGNKVKPSMLVKKVYADGNKVTLDKNGLLSAQDESDRSVFSVDEFKTKFPSYADRVLKNLTDRKEDLSQGVLIQTDKDGYTSFHAATDANRNKSKFTNPAVAAIKNFIGGGPVKNLQKTELKQKPSAEIMTLLYKAVAGKGDINYDALSFSERVILDNFLANNVKNFIPAKKSDYIKTIRKTYYQTGEKIPDFSIKEGEKLHDLSLPKTKANNSNAKQVTPVINTQKAITVPLQKNLPTNTPTSKKVAVKSSALAANGVTNATIGNKIVPAANNSYTPGLTRLLPGFDISSLDPALKDKWTDENGKPLDEAVKNLAQQQSSGVKWDDNNYNKPDMDVLNNPDEYKKYENYINSLSDEKVLDIFKNVTGKDGRFGDVYKKYYQGKNVGKLRKNLTDKNVGLAHRLGFTAYKEQNTDYSGSNDGSKSNANFNMRNKTNALTNEDKSNLDLVKGNTKDGFSLSNQDKENKDLAFGDKNKTAATIADRTKKVGSYIETAYNLGKVIIGTMGASQPLPVWEVPEKWKEYVRTNEENSKQGFTTKQKSVLEDEQQRNRSAATEAIRQTVGGGGSSGAVLGALDGLNRNVRLGKNDFALKDAELQRENLGTYGNVLSKDVSIDRQLYEDELQKAVTSKNAFGALAASGTQAIIDKGQFDNTYGKGSNYDKLQQAIVEQLQSTTAALKSNNIAQIGAVTPSDKSQAAWLSLSDAEREKLKLNPIYDAFWKK